MNAAAVPKVKALLRNASLNEMQAWARQVLAAEDASSARELAKKLVSALS
jgi:phosphoenolpyruvate-protein kinase (PTS system EI component)